MSEERAPGHSTYPHGMELSWAVFPWVCCAIFLATIILSPVLARHPARLHDLQANIYLSRRGDVIACAVV